MYFLNREPRVKWLILLLCIYVYIFFDDKPIWKTLKKKLIISKFYEWHKINNKIFFEKYVFIFSRFFFLYLSGVWLLSYRSRGQYKFYDNVFIIYFLFSLTFFLGMCKDIYMLCVYISCCFIVRTGYYELHKKMLIAYFDC